MNIGTLQAYLGLETAEFDRKMAKSIKSIEDAGKKMRDIGKKMSLMITLPLILAGGAAVKLASDLEENINKTKESFKQAADSVLEWSDTTVTSIGLAKSTALEMVSLFGDMATSMGYSREGAAELSMSLVTLAADLASFKNISIDQAQTALAGIFTGETESLKRLGIVMTQSALESFTAAKGMKEYSDKMTQAEKVAVRYAYVMDATKNAQGDFARTSGGTANQMRIFQESVKELGASFGKFLLPVVTPMIKGFSQLMQRMSTLTDVQKKWIIGIAAVAAATGPLLYGLGMVVKIAPSVVKGLLAIQGALAKLMTVIKANQYLALAAAIIAIGVGLYSWLKKTKDVTNAQSELLEKTKEVQQLYTQGLAKETAETKLLFETLKKTNPESKEREKLLNQINTTYNTTLTNMKDETAFLKQIDTSYSNIVSNLREKILLESQTTAITPLLQSQNDALANLQLIRNKSGYREDITDLYEWAKEANNTFVSGLSNNYRWLQTYVSQYDEAETKIASIISSTNQLLQGTKGTPDPITPPGTPPGTPTETKDVDARTKLNNEYALSIQLTKDQNELDALKLKYAMDLFEVRKAEYFLNPTQDEVVNLQAENKAIQEQTKALQDRVILQRAMDEATERVRATTIRRKEAEQGINEEYKLALYLAQDKKAQLQAEYDKLSSIYQLKKQLAGDDKVFSEEELATLKLINDQLTAQKFILDSMRVDDTPQTWADKWSSAAEQVEAAINQAMETVVDGLINAMTSVEKVDIGQFLMNTLAELAIRVGKIALMTAIAIEGIKKALMSLNPVAALVAGIALIALGTAVKASLANSVQGLATGGQVTKSGAFMVGEEGPELVTLNAGSAVIPNHELGGNVNKTEKILSMLNTLQSKIDNIQIMTTEILEIINDMMVIISDMSDRLKRLMWTSLLGPAGVLFAGMESGGNVTKSGAFMVGEAGHEMVIPSRNGVNFSKNLLGNTGGGEPYILSTRISGRDLEVIMERAKAQNKRR